jgi:hypothetical protein
MKFAKEKQTYLEEKLLMIFTECMLQYKTTRDEKYIEEWYFMQEVKKANLAETTDQWFLLGALAYRVHDVAPKAMKLTLDIMAKDDLEKKKEQLREKIREKLGRN